MIVIEGGTHHLAALEAGETVGCAEIGAGTHAEDDDAFEDADFPNTDTHELSKRHLRAVIPPSAGGAGDFSGNEAEKERRFRVEIHGRIWDRCRAFFDRVATAFRVRLA